MASDQKKTHSQGGASRLQEVGLEEEALEFATELYTFARLRGFARPFKHYLENARALLRSREAAASCYLNRRAYIKDPGEFHRLLDHYSKNGLPLDS